MSRLCSVFHRVYHKATQQTANGESRNTISDAQPHANGYRKLHRPGRTKTWRRRAERRLDRRAIEQVDPHLVAFHRTHPMVTEQYHKLYNEIIRRGRTRELRTLLITSPLQDEGKSMTALNLASTIIMNGEEQNVLLVETDFRKPSVHHKLGTRPDCGLSDYLLGDVEFNQIFSRTPIPGLTVVYAGRKVQNPMALVRSDKLAQFFKAVKAQTVFSHILLDSSAVLLTAEPTALIPHVDAALLVVRSGQTPSDAITQAVETLGAEHILGCVFNGLRASDAYGYHHYHKSSYYRTDDTRPPSA